MSGYLDKYGAGEQKRENLLRNGILLVLGIVIFGGLGVYVCQTFHQVRVVHRFLGLVKEKDYATAYQAWGCTASQPCPGYAYDKFLEDWGPKSPAGTDPVLKVIESENCGTGVMVRVQISGAHRDIVWVEKSGDSLSYSPVEFCPGKSSYSIMVHRTIGRLRILYF